jgi:DHA1 family inner membrane transport protein
VSFYALGVAVGGPLLATFTGRFRRKLMLLIYVSIFAVGYVACALAPNFGSLLTARVVVSLIHGAYFGAAMVLSTTLVNENRRGFAVALILSGLTVANILGVPLGTAIGQAFGWRSTFWAVAALGAVSLAAIALLVPADAKQESKTGNLLEEIKALGREPVYTSLAIIILQTVGQFALFTYISPVLTDVSGISSDLVPWLLLVFGIGSTIGVLLGGRLSDWKLMPTLIGVLAVQVVVYLLMTFLIGSAWAMTVLVLAWGMTSFAFGAPVQTRILNSTRDAPLLSASLIPSAFNIAIAGGAWFGGALIDGGFGYGILPWVGVVGTLAAVLVAVVSAQRGSRV